MAVVAQRRHAEALKEAVRLRHSDGSAYYLLSECRYVLGHGDGMIEILRLAIGHQPDHGQAHERLGKVLVEDGKLLEALRHAERASKLQPGVPSARKLVENIRKQLAKETVSTSG